jgi:signal transduction histidine kinase
MWVFFSITCLLAAIICVALGMFVYFANRNKIINQSFMVVSILIGLWCLFSFITSIVENKEIMLFWGRLLYVAAFFTPSAFFHFVFITLNISEKKYTRLAIKISYLISFLFCFITFSQLFINDILQRTPSTRIVPGPLYACYVLFFLSLCPYAIYQIFLTFKNSYGYKRDQLKFLFLGFLIALLAGGIHLSSAYFAIEIFPHDLLIIIWSMIISYAILRYQLMDIRFVITRAGLFILVYTIVLGIPFYVFYHSGSGLLSTSFAVILASIGPITYRRLHQKAEGVFFAEQKRYQNALRETSSSMVREHDLERLLEMVVNVLSDVVKIDHVEAFIDNKGNNSYQLKASNNSAFNKQISDFSHSHPLINFLKLTKEPLAFEELPDQIKNSFNTKATISLIIPSFIEHRLLGFIFLGQKVNQAIYSVDDISVFATVANQLALAIENCLYLEESKKTHERLFTAEKLASIGGMAEGIAHQIMNRLNQFALNSEAIGTKVKKFQTNNPDASSKTPDITNMLNDLSAISNSLAGNVSRTTDIVKGILSYSNIEIKEQDYSSFRLSEIVNPALELIKIKHNVKDIPLQIVETKAAIFGVKAQLMEVIYNMMDNAYESILEKKEFLKKSNKTENGYQPAIILRTKTDEALNKTIIVVSDNGIGIREENKPKVFAPFFSTKSSNKSGSGIGCYIVKRMIEENHNGKIWFDSDYLIGTTFYIEIPGIKSGAV